MFLRNNKVYEAFPDLENLRMLAELPDPDQLLFNTSYKPNGDLAVFKYFERLPLELRLMVWRHSFPRGRPIHLHLGSFGNILYRFNDNPRPVTAEVNRESRHETLRCYGDLSVRQEELCFIEDIRTRHSRIWFNPRVDTVIVDTDDFGDPEMEYLEDLFRGDEKRIRNIQSLRLVSTVMTEKPDLFAYTVFFSSYIDLLEFFPHLKRLELVLKIYDQNIYRGLKIAMILEHDLLYHMQEEKQINSNYNIPEIIREVVW